MRSFVVISVHDDVDIGKNILKMLPKESKILVYMRKSLENGDFSRKIQDFDSEKQIFVKYYPDELRFNGSKLRNFVSHELFDEKTAGFAHIIEDNVEIFNSPDVFLDKIEEMMSVFQLNTWFETSCDGCNLVYSKYNPRLYIAVDEPEAKKHYDKTIAWCSNANTLWVCYNMDRCAFEDVRFEEKFQFPMYYIIEFLARRRNTKKPGQMDYMNYYPSVPEELDVFRCIDVKGGRNFTNEEIKAEGQLFSEMKVDNHPDSSVDMLMEDMRSKILQWEKK